MAFYMELQQDDIKKKGPIFGPLEDICVCETDISAGCKGRSIEFPLKHIMYRGQKYNHIMITDERDLSRLDKDWKDRLEEYQSHLKQS